MLAALQILILLTGNYTFFNWLTLTLCLMLCDDFALAKVLPRRLAALYAQEPAHPAAITDRHRLWRRALIAPVVILITGISLFQLLSPFGPLPRWAMPVATAHQWLSPLRSVNFILFPPAT